MKKLLLIPIIIILHSCEMRDVSKKIDFIVTEKSVLYTTPVEHYYLHSKDTVLDVNPNDYMRYNIGDTIKFKMDTIGFFRGTLFLRKDNE